MDKIQDPLNDLTNDCYSGTWCNSTSLCVQHDKSLKPAFPTNTKFVFYNVYTNIKGKKMQNDDSLRKLTYDLADSQEEL